MGIFLLVFYLIISFKILIKASFPHLSTALSVQKLRCDYNNVTEKLNRYYGKQKSLNNKQCFTINIQVFCYCLLTVILRSVLKTNNREDQGYL